MKHAATAVVTRVHTDKRYVSSPRTHWLLSVDLCSCASEADNAPASFVDFRVSSDCVQLSRLLAVAIRAYASPRQNYDW